MSIKQRRRGRSYTARQVSVISVGGLGAKELKTLQAALNVWSAGQQNLGARLSAIEIQAASILAAEPCRSRRYDDSPADYARRISASCRLIRLALDRGNIEQAAMDAITLGVLLGEAAMWSAISATGASGGRPVGKKLARDQAMAREFERRRNKARGDISLMIDIGRAQLPPLGRTASIDAIRRGLAALQNPANRVSRTKNQTPTQKPSGKPS